VNAVFKEKKRLLKGSGDSLGRNIYLDIHLSIDGVYRIGQEER
jgi:hypothetical protein